MALLLSDFNHFLISRDDPSTNVVPHEFAFANSDQVFYRDKPLTHQSQILRLQGGAGSQAALPTTDAVSSRLLRIHAGHFTRPGPFGKKKTPFSLTKKPKGV
jgi:hypothetical protein